MSQSPAGVWQLLFEAGGVELVKAQVADLSKFLKEQSEAGDKLAKSLSTGMVPAERMMRGVLDASKSLGRELGSLTGMIAGFARAGIQGTAEGNILAFSLRRLSFEIAGLFTPQIHGAIDVLQNLVATLHNLDGAQVASLRNAILAGAAFAGLATGTLNLGRGVALLALGTQEGQKAMMDLGKAVVDFGVKFGEAVTPIIVSLSDMLIPLIHSLTDALQGPLGKWLAFAGVVLLLVPQIVSVIKGLITTYTALAAVLTFVTTLQGPAGIAKVAAAMIAAGVVAGGIAALVSSLDSSGSHGTRTGGGHEGLTIGGGQIEQAQSLFTRLQSSAVMTDYAQRTANNTGEIVTILRDRSPWRQPINPLPAVGQ